MVGVWWGSSSRLQTASLSLYPRTLCILIGWRAEGGSKLSQDFYKVLNPINEGSPSGLHLILIASPMPHLLIASPWGVGFHHRNLLWMNTFSLLQLSVLYLLHKNNEKVFLHFPWKNYRTLEWSDLGDLLEFPSETIGPVFFVLW